MRGVGSATWQDVAVLIPLADCVSAAGARLVVPDGVEPPAVVDGAAIDSRTVRGGEVFVAVTAERDGHDFVAAAAEAGAVAALVQRPVDAPVTQLVTDDTVGALGRIGAIARDELVGPVIGVTGSVGKTSTKDLLAAVCARAGVTTASARSFNNEMGVPLTLVNAHPSTARTIIEMGARGPGHIAALCGIARPTVGVVTAVAAAHTEMFGSIEGVASAKGELVEALDASGTAVLHLDDPLVAAMADRTQASVLGYGESSPSADVRAVDVSLEDLCPTFVLHTPWGRERVRLGVRGRHNVANALAAAAAALASGVGFDDVVAGLADAELSASRMAFHRLPGGGIVIDDAYNANPTSMRAALAALVEVEAERRVAVVGLMAELGDTADDEHRALAAEFFAAGVELVVVGTDLYGLDPVSVDVAVAMGPPSVGEAVLLKGSRVAELDRVARAWILGGPPAR